MADPKYMNHDDMPGNDQADPDFYRYPSTTRRAPADSIPSSNGNIGFDEAFGGGAGKSLTSTGPFKDLKGGR